MLGNCLSACGEKTLFFWKATGKDFRKAKIFSGCFPKISFAERSEAKKITQHAQIKTLLFFQKTLSLHPLYSKRSLT